MYRYCVLSLLAFASTAKAQSSAPPAVIEDLARTWVSQRAAVERLKVRRDRLEDVARDSRSTSRGGRDELALELLTRSRNNSQRSSLDAERDARIARAKLWAAEIARHDRAAAGEASAPLVRTVHWIDRAAWILGPLALAGLPFIVLHDRRHALRRGFGRNAWLAGLVIMVGMGAGCAALGAVMLAMPVDPEPPAPTQPPLDRFASEVAALVRDREALVLECERREKDLGRAEDDSPLRHLSYELAESTSMQAELMKQAHEDGRLAEIIGTELATSGAGLSTRAMWHAGAGAGLCALAATGWFVSLRGERRRARRADTCPACAQRGSLRLDRRTNSARCGQAACGFELPESDRVHPRLAIAVLGATGSGKTHWLAAAAREFAAGRYTVRGSTVPSKRTSELETIAATIFDERRGPSPTPAGALPLPFVVHDRDRLGSTDLLLTVREVAPNELRVQRADGFIVVLDPTQPVEPQRNVIGMLKNSRRVPLGFALTKIDRLTSPAAERFFADLTSLDPAGRSISRGVLRRRSLLTAAFVAAHWPEWDPAGELTGRRCAWFPITPVGLNEPGEIDLRRRVIEPFATLEPLLWLADVRGYRVLR